MRVPVGRNPAPAAIRGATIALGVLDGVHRGHQAVLDAAKNAAPDAPLAAAVFEPHPRCYFQPQAAPFRLQTPAQRARAVAACGGEAVFEIPFDQDLAALSAEAFARAVIVEALGARHVAVGADFRFGHDRAGDAAKLTALGQALGFGVSIVEDVMQENTRVSSSLIRARIAQGEATRAARLLTRPFAIEGAVIQGAQRGRTINFPTANIALGDYVRPKFGVYAVRAVIDGAIIAGVANVGVKPTVGAAEPLLEAHLFDFAGDLYGRTIEIGLIDFIRTERKFDSFEALRAQIEADAQAARARLSVAP
ncbi:MAG: bifunctional riboflavin kinase/FAD synthetase [Hyphomonadaceae bacterium]